MSSIDAVPELHFHQREARIEVAQRLVGEARRLALSRDAVEPGGVGLHATAKGATQQLVDRLPVELAHDVPERDVDRADRGDHRSLAAVVARHVVHAVPQHLGVERIAADHQRPQRVLDHRGGDLGRLEPLRECLAPPDQPIVGDDLEQRGGALPDPPLRERERFRQRALQDVHLQVGDLHRTRNPGGSKAARRSDARDGHARTRAAAGRVVSASDARSDQASCERSQGNARSARCCADDPDVSSSRPFMGSGAGCT